ncbi:MAG: endonuclease/exonuclease/phosphatase family protein [Clostridiales bacterium]|nr:endonuclease/exonuclease/phosphatase family protein [Clostridiales bacterium]
MTKHIKKIAIAIALMFAALILVAACYMIYVAASYTRISDNLPLATNNVKNQPTEIILGEEYEILTYNIGFGAYGPNYSFFMDKGVMTSGKKVRGKYGKGISKDDVRHNTNGIVSLINNLNYDFVFAQEVDEDGNRSYHINQLDLIKSHMEGYSSVYAKDFHSAFLYYPLNDPHGKNDSGLLTLSRFSIEQAVRYSLPVSSGVSKYFDLDRCFSVSRVKAGDKQLVLINVHLSAYDNEIKAQQLSVLNDFFKKEEAKGNYVIAGGDFNYDICDSIGSFKTEQLVPDWVSVLSSEELSTGFRVAVADNKDVPTCRSSDMSYKKDVNFTVIVDGFIVSDNIEVVSVENQNTEFAYSDHNPVHMKFVLK